MLLPRLHLPTIALVCATVCIASVRPGKLSPSTQDSPDKSRWVSGSHNSEFSPVEHSSGAADCGSMRPPEELATPNPLLDARNSAVTVSFIVGKDGRVYSPLVLHSAGASADHPVIEAVRSWRYRPALCNGVPTEAEATIEFSRR